MKPCTADGSVVPLQNYFLLFILCIWQTSRPQDPSHDKQMPNRELNPSFRLLSNLVSMRLSVGEITSSHYQGDEIPANQESGNADKLLHTKFFSTPVCDCCRFPGLTVASAKHPSAGSCTGLTTSGSSAKRSRLTHPTLQRCLGRDHPHNRYSPLSHTECPSRWKSPGRGLRPQTGSPR